MRWLVELDELSTAAAGSFYLVASENGQVRVQGSVSEARRVFYAQARGVTVAASHAHLLAWLCGAGLDVRQVAARMAYGDLPHPLASASLWSGVRGLPGACALYVDGSGQGRVLRWWRPPDPALPLTEGSAAVRGALLDAVSARVTPGQTLAADLSGGLDSTSICFLAAHAGARSVTVTLCWTGPGNEDAAWAAQAAALLPGLQRLVYTPEQLPAYFTDIGEPGEPLDEPTLAIRDRAIQRVIATDLTALGAAERLVGHGGDHVLQAPPHYLHGLLRRHPGQALRQARGWRALHRWPAAATTASPMTSAPEGWGNELRLPPWASAHAVEALTGLLRETAQTAEPLASSRGQHARIHQAQAAGRTARQIEHATTAAGVPATSPFSTGSSKPAWPCAPRTPTHPGSTSRS